MMSERHAVLASWSMVAVGWLLVAIGARRYGGALVILAMLLMVPYVVRDLVEGRE